MQWNVPALYFCYFYHLRLLPQWIIRAVQNSDISIKVIKRQAVHSPAAQSAIGTAGADLLLGGAPKSRHDQWGSVTASEFGSRSQWSVVEVPVSKGSGVSDLLDYEAISLVLYCAAEFLPSGLRGSRISLLCR